MISLLPFHAVLYMNRLRHIPRFGALAMSPSTGILLNNQMNDFANPGVQNAYGLVPSPTNYIRPGKHPVSSISPVVMVDGQDDVVAVVSSTGAFSICTGIVQVRHISSSIEVRYV